MEKQLGRQQRNPGPVRSWELRGSILESRKAHPAKETRPRWQWCPQGACGQHAETLVSSHVPCPSVDVEQAGHGVQQGQGQVNT